MITSLSGSPRSDDELACFKDLVLNASENINDVFVCGNLGKIHRPASGCFLSMYQNGRGHSSVSALDIPTRLVSVSE